MGGIAIRVHPRRGLDIGAAWFRGVPLAWIGAAGEGGGDAADWREAWGGGLVTTCGPGEERTTRIAITVEDVG